MDVLLDIQSELSLPEGGCGVDALVRRAAELGVSGLALADRATLAAAPQFIRHARAAGLEPRVGIRIGLRGGGVFDLLLFPRRQQDFISLELFAAGRGEASAADLSRAGGAEAFLAIAAVHPHSVGDRDALHAASVALEEVRSVLGRGLWLALPSSGHASQGDPSSFSPLVELGRDLHLPQVLAPSVCIVEAEDAPLHRLLVSIRGDHETFEEAPRSGRPAAESGPDTAWPALYEVGALSGAPWPVSHAAWPDSHAAWPAPQLRRNGRQASRLGSLVEAARLRADTALHEETENLFAQIAAPDSLIEPPAPGPLGDWEDLECLREKVLSACAGRRRLAPLARLNAELEALARRRAVSPMLKLGEVMRSLAPRPMLGVAPEWSASWVGWALGLTGSPPAEDGRHLPPWVDDGHGPLPLIELETGEVGARAARTLLEIAGARQPITPDRLTAVGVARWLGEARGFDPAQVRRLVALVEGRPPVPERAPPGSRRLAALAVRLAGRVVALPGSGDVRVWLPSSAPGRKLDRFAEDALATGGLGVRVSAGSVLSILERAGVGGRALAGAPAAPRAGGTAGDRAVDWNGIAEVLAGPLAGRGGAAFARVLRARRPRDRRELARSLVLVRRAPDAPAPRLPGGMPGSAPVSSATPIVFTADLVAALRARGVTEATAEDLLLRGAEGRGAPLASLRPDLQRQLEAAGQPPEQAEVLLAAIPRLVPHLEEEGPWLARAGAFAVLGDLAHGSPALLASAMADLHPGRLPAIAGWARAHDVAILSADLNTSAVDSEVEDSDRGTSLVRLGLMHLPGVDRATADVIAMLRGPASFAGSEDVQRRLHGRIPDSILRRLLRGPTVPAESSGPPRAVPSASPPAVPSDSPPGPIASRKPVPAGWMSGVPVTRRSRSLRRSARALDRVLEGGGDRVQYDLFAAGQSGPRVFTAALSRYGILRLDRAARAPEGSRLRTVGVIRGLRGTVARGGRRLAAARLEDGDWGFDLLLMSELLEAGGDIHLGRPVIVDGFVAAREGRAELVVESAVPLESLSDIAQPALELVLPARFRRVRVLKLRLLQSPGRSPVRVRAQDAEDGAMAAALSRLAVTLDDGLIADLRDLVGDDNVYWVGGVIGQAGAA